MGCRHEYKRGYTNGYNAGRGPNWPSHKPPSPPDPLLAGLFEAVRKLRDGVDGELAKFDPDDPITEYLGPLVDGVDEAMTAIGDWLKSADAEMAQGTERGAAGMNRTNSERQFMKYNVTITTDNPFHLGWIMAHLGQECPWEFVETNTDDPYKREAAIGCREGHEMYGETFPQSPQSPAQVFRKCTDDASHTVRIDATRSP